MDRTGKMKTAQVIEALIQEVSTRGYGDVDTAPHEFVPLKRFRNQGRCKVCMAHQELHPAIGWLPARPLQDKSQAIPWSV